MVVWWESPSRATHPGNLPPQPHRTSEQRVQEPKPSGQFQRENQGPVDKPGLDLLAANPPVIDEQQVSQFDLARAQRDLSGAPGPIRSVNGSAPRALPLSVAHRRAWWGAQALMRRPWRLDRDRRSHKSPRLAGLHLATAGPAGHHRSQQSAEERVWAGSEEGTASCTMRNSTRLGLN